MTSPRALLDTSYLVRYLTGDPPHLAEEAAEVIEGEDTLAINSVILVEAAYVLTEIYEVRREAVVDQLIAFLQRENIVLLGFDKGLAIEGLLFCRPSGRVSFADALVWAEARSRGIRTVHTFDGRFPPLPG